MQWIEAAKTGDADAQAALWDRFDRRLRAVARRHLANAATQMSNEEDISAKVLKSFLMRLVSGQLSPPKDENQLWKLLARMTRNKTAEEIRRQMRERHGGPGYKKTSDSSFSKTECQQFQKGLSDIVDPMPDPREAFERAQAIHRLLQSLPDETLKQVALLRMSEFSNKEIAEQLGLAVRTIEDRVRRIRQHILNLSAGS